MEYTIRNVPPDVDKAIRDRTKGEETSVNELVLTSLRQYLGLQNDVTPKRRNLRKFVGKHHFDQAFEEMMSDFDKIDPELWK